MLVGDKIGKAVAERRAELAKAADASKVYEETMAKAEEDKKTMIDEAVAHKNKLIDEAKLAATQKADLVLADADKKAGNIVREAEEKAVKLEKDLKDGFTEGVKKTAGLVVNKLFNKDISLKEEYVDSLVAEYTK